MSDYRAIAGVSATLRTLLMDRMENPTTVTLTAPDIEPDNVADTRINLFLFQIKEHPYLRNQEIPGTGHPAAYGTPPLSLELYYLLTPYGVTEQDDQGAHEILGDAMRVLHDFRVITDSLLQENVSPGDPVLDVSLIGEYEKVKICLEPIGAKDIAEIWNAFTVPYRLSVVYQVSVVQIESRRPRRLTRLVGEPPDAGPRVHVAPFRSPFIREIRVRRQDDPLAKERPYPFARVGDRLIILGQNLSGGRTRVTIGDVDVTAGATLRETRIEVDVPDDPALQPGTQLVRVLKDVIVRTPPEPPTSFFSNVAFFLVVPRAQTLTPDLGATPPNLTITGTRLFDPDQDSLTLVGDEVIRSADYTTATPTEIAFDLPAGLPSGEYPVRVRVGGAESIESQTITIP